MAFTARSEPTRTAILTHARRLLAERGYEGTTIRAVAAAAGVDPSMVMRYYGNKEGLFGAAVDLDLHFPDPAGWPRDEIGVRLARHFVARWEGELADELTQLLLRSATTNSAAVEQMRAVFGGQVLRFVQQVTGADSPEVTRRASMLATQVLGVALCRYVLALPPVVVMDADTLVAMLAPVVQHYLTGDLAAAV
ncbi:MAG TPA: TetR family transcriptional regulator [Pseudonocardia sp.]|jgi:AcrR family transcriptional regulator|nr:TetR family transcriptional regulator [Pseudonocardia sp.]